VDPSKERDRNMSAYISTIREQLGRLHRREEGQDAFEYLLVVGGVSVAIVIATIVLATSAPGVVTTVQGLIDGVLS
jgi:hypothetical protein